MKKVFRYKTFKDWLYTQFPEQKDSLIISEYDELNMALAFHAGRSMKSVCDHSNEVHFNCKKCGKKCACFKPFPKNQRWENRKRI